MALRPLASLLFLTATAGCTLIDLSQLGSGSGAGNSGGDASGASNPSGGGPADGGNGAGGSSGVDSGGNGGSPPLPTYDECLLAEMPSVYFRLSSPELAANETNLGSLGGDAGFGGGHMPAPSLVASTDQSTVFVDLNGDGSLVWTGGNRLFGGHAPVSVELWLETPDPLSTVALARYQQIGDRIELRIIERPVSDGLDAIELRFITSAPAERGVLVYLDLQNPPKQLIHVVGVYRQTEATLFAGDGSSNDMAIYLNGVLASEATTGDPVPLPSLVGNLEIGAGFQGSLDELAVYDRELDADDVARHYAFGLSASTNCGAD